MAASPSAAMGMYQTFPVTILQDHAAIAKAAAARIAQALRAKPNLVLGLATGATMEPVYQELVRLHKDEGLDFSQAQFFNLDAYKGVPATDRNSYDFQLRKLLIDPVGAPPSHVHFVQGAHFDCDAYEAEIKKFGGIDIQLLGLGGDGHIGFNEVQTGKDKNLLLTSRTREVALSPRTIKDNAMYFSQPGETMPTHAYTMGIGTILEAKELLVLANNPNKALTVKKLVETKPFSTAGAAAHQKRFGPSAEDAVAQLPAAASYLHPAVTMLVDREAASLLSHKDLIARGGMDEAHADGLRREFTSEEITLTIDGEEKPFLLPPNFDFYDPACMGIDEPFARTNPHHLAALGKALSQATDVIVGAHQDDAEIMAGAIQLSDREKGADTRWLSVIVTDGAASNSSLVGNSTKMTAKELTIMRQNEQREAAQMMGAPVIQLKYPSAASNAHLGEGKKQEVAYALAKIFSAAPQMQRVYGHNPLDKHDTHLGVLACQTAALRASEKDNPKLAHVYGMEVWGGLTTMEPVLKMFPVSQQVLDRLHTVIQRYQSQIEGQARDYADTTIARYMAHGGYVSNPHMSKPPAGMPIALDITAFTRDKRMGFGDYISEVMHKVETIRKDQSDDHAILPLETSHQEQYKASRADGERKVHGK